MNPSKGYYSVIQYCPDLGRLEAANIGVLLFCLERHFLKAAMATDNSRIRQFFGSEGHDWKRLKSIKEGLRDRLGIEEGSIRTRYQARADDDHASLYATAGDRRRPSISVAGVDVSLAEVGTIRNREPEKFDAMFSTEPRFVFKAEFLDLGRFQ